MTGGSEATFYRQPGFFKPKLWPNDLSRYEPDQLSYYDTSPLKDTLLELVNFDYINNTKEVRLSLCAVDLESGDFKIFDSFNEEIRPEHVMASGAMPPGFPPGIPAPSQSRTYGRATGPPA